VVWITAGFRLEQEVGGPWAARMIEALNRHPGAVWLLVGGKGQMPKALQQSPPGKVRALATRPDMAAVLSVCDIYVNPPRMGGGFSVAEAMAARLPVLAFAGSDGGDKVGEWALPGIDAYMERLAALTENSALRSEMGEALCARFIERFDLEASGPSLISACELAVTRAAGRLKSTAS
jgi:glycosyltransferase involved in cell wall biosynthesis